MTETEIDRTCYACGDAHFKLGAFNDMGLHYGVSCPNCGEYAYGSNSMLAVRSSPPTGLNLEALVKDLQEDPRP